NTRSYRKETAGVYFTMGPRGTTMQPRRRRLNLPSLRRRWHCERGTRCMSAYPVARPVRTRRLVSETNKAHPTNPTGCLLLSHADVQNAPAVPAATFTRCRLTEPGLRPG